MTLELYLKVIMAQSDSIKNLATALSKVQGKLTYAKKDSANPFFKSRYADLESDRKSTRLNSSHSQQSRMPSSA